MPLAAPYNGATIMRDYQLTPSQASALAASQRVTAAKLAADERRASFKRFCERTGLAHA